MIESHRSICSIVLSSEAELVSKGIYCILLPMVLSGTDFILELEFKLRKSSKYCGLLLLIQLVRINIW